MLLCKTNKQRSDLPQNIVHNLHGMPGLFGGLAALIVAPNIAKAQLSGIVFTVAFAFVSGLLGGYIRKATGSKNSPYDDIEEFVE